VIAARHAIQRPTGARLLHLDAHGKISHEPRARLVDLLRPGDLLIANDAATLPASLFGMHLPTGARIEVRLAQRLSLDGRWGEVRAFVFGDGDWRTRTEERPLPPPLAAGDELLLGDITAVVMRSLGHPRFVALRFEASDAQVWAALARHGRPIQYAHLAEPLEIWDVWTPIAGAAVAFEPPSAGFVLDWHALDAMCSRRIAFATITHAAGISSTGDACLDALLPLDEPYRITQGPARAIRDTRERGGRVVALGTTVVRALEHAHDATGAVHVGDGIATQRIGPGTRLRVVDAIVSGTHEPGTSHYELLRAFADDPTLARAAQELEHRGYRTHEYGDSVLIERRDQCWSSSCAGSTVAAPSYHFG
jgi:S-adenosylmethionine:tRNA ribosyltransferase-isomerase